MNKAKKKLMRLISKRREKRRKAKIVHKLYKLHARMIEASPFPNFGLVAHCLRTELDELRVEHRIHLEQYCVRFMVESVGFHGIFGVGVLARRPRNRLECKKYQKQQELHDWMREGF